jgi:hypothetical protein
MTPIVTFLGNVCWNKMVVFFCFKTLFGLGIDSFRLKNNPQKIIACYLYPLILKKSRDVKGTQCMAYFHKKYTQYNMSSYILYASK